jgi:hypothetical protein
MLLLGFVLLLYFTSVIEHLTQNMTEDDWRWHMYDTVRHSFAFLYISEDSVCRLKDQIGSATKMLFIICAEKPPTLLLRYESWSFLLLSFSYAV